LYATPEALDSCVPYLKTIMEATIPTREMKRLLMVMVEEGIVWDNPGKPRTILSSTTSTRIPANSLKRLGTKGWKLPDERVNSGSQPVAFVDE